MTTPSRHQRLDLNAATLNELTAVPGLTPRLARRIIAHRPFGKIKELLHVRGLEPDIYFRIEPCFKIGPSPKTTKKPAQRITTRKFLLTEPPTQVEPTLLPETLAAFPSLPAAELIFEPPPIETPANGKLAEAIIEPLPVEAEPLAPAAEIALEPPTVEVESAAAADFVGEADRTADAETAVAPPEPEVVLPEIEAVAEEAPLTAAESPSVEEAQQPEPAPAVEVDTRPSSTSRVEETKAASPVETTRPAEPEQPPPPEPEPAIEVSWPSSSTSSTYAASARAASFKPEPAAEDVIYDAEVVFDEPRPVRPPSPNLRIVPAPSREVMVHPLARIGDVVFDSYLGPRLLFILLAVTVGVALISFATGFLTLGADSPLAQTEATPKPVGIRVVTASPASAALAPIILPAQVVAVAPTVQPQTSPTSSPNFAPNSGLAGAGAQIFNETFSPGGYWDLGDNDFSNMVIADDRLTIRMKQAGAIAWTLSGYAGRDFFYQGTASVGACRAGDYYGLVFRSQRDGSRYLFGLSCDGQYRVIHQVGGEYQTLIDFTFTTLAVSGSDASNLLAVRAEGGQLSFYLNDQFLASMDNADPGPGLFGAFVRSSETQTLQVDFDDLAAWEIGP